MTGQRQYDRGVRVVVFPPQDVLAPTVLPLIVNKTPPISGVPASPQTHVQFSIQRSLTPEPGGAQIRLFNLSRTTRDTITGTVRQIVDWLPTEPFVKVDGILRPGGNEVTSTLAGMAAVRLDAGYTGALSTVFTGTVLRARSTRQGADRVTTLECTDGGFQLAVASANQVFTPGASAITVVEYLAGVLGLTLAPTAGLADLSGFKLVAGFRAIGDANRGIADIADALQLTWWIEEGQIWILRDGESLPSDPVAVTTEDIPGAIRLRREPEPVESGGIRIQCLLAPEVRVGHQVALVTDENRGTYRVEAVQHMGGNRSGQFDTVAVIRNPSPL